MAKKPKLGSGARFKALKGKLAAKGATNPGALAAYIGRKKYGATKFAKLSAGGKKRKEPEAGETMKHEKGESKAFEKKEHKGGVEKRKRASVGTPSGGDLRSNVRVGKLKTQDVLVNPTQRLRKAMKRLAKNG